MTEASSKDTMTLQKFEDLLDLYGRLDRWPPALRANATALLNSEPRAGELLAEWESAARMLDHVPSVDPSVELMRRIRLIPDTQEAVSVWQWLGLGRPALWRTAVGFSFCAVLGVTAGWQETALPLDGADDVESELTALALASDLDWEARDE